MKGGLFVPIKEHVTADIGNEQRIYEFENGYGASVIRGEYTYGGSNGLFELAVLSDGHLCYSTPITDDVIGWLSEEKVQEILQKISDLPCVGSGADAGKKSVPSSEATP